MTDIKAEIELQRSDLWRGFGLWNFYFLAKIALYWADFIGFDVFYNLLLAAFLLLPVKFKKLHITRGLFALPAAIALLYYDSWLPPFSRLLEQPDILKFSNAYMLELALRFINWQLLGIGFIFIVVYLFLTQWLRMTAWTLLALLLAVLPSVPGVPRLLWADTANTVTQRLNIVTDNPQAASLQGSDLNSLLNEELERFYTAEQSRMTEFALPLADAAPFDVLLLNICSLAWTDLEVSQLTQHPLFAKMDIIFDNFNSATSYSGPAVLRLMRASCGQTAHEALYQPADRQCHLFDNLKQFGFTGNAALNHTGEFEGFIDELSLAGFASPPMIPSNIKPKLKAFDGSPIWGDYDALKLWWTDRLQQNTSSAALLYNTISLHDGNREATLDGGSRSSPYAKRAKTLLDDLDAFMDVLAASDRQVMVVFVPEHGAALEGDRMQIPGMREIPTSDITHVPVGVRFIGTQAIAPETTLQISTPTSYLALSELISRVIKRDVFDQPQVEWRTLISDLPETQAISENSGTVMMNYQGVPYLRLGERDWVKYAR
ncbi:cellulose biosynthesis protein BcsG [Pseudomonas sp. C27(2019)]|uniref:cellulose biosynthesis protein BcsG n=1 Tax=Pseudomonas sp. C27(2019) TaxID=2604941 RepID=UPI0021150DD7|nr:cellulose biosynthesis protein BcsG [Pseudomonas sp. C27(2019)]